MFMQDQNTTVLLLPSRIGSAPVAPKRVVYERWQGKERTLSGTIVEKLPIAQRGYPGVYTFDYRIVPDPGLTNLSSHWVSESAVMWHKDAPKCPRCNDLGFLSIAGDEAENCPCCNPMGGEVVW